MKNFRSQGDVVDFIAPAGGTVSGQGYLIGTSLLVFALETVAAGVELAGRRTGELEVDKEPADVMAAGDKVNWDNVGKHVQNGASTLDGAATVSEPADGTVSKVRVLLTPV